MLCVGIVPLLYILAFHIDLAISANLTQNTEMNLIGELLSTYDVNARPVSNSQNTVIVDVDYTLDGIINVHEDSQTVTSTGEVTFLWNDPYLSWNESRYEGVKTLSLDKTRVWLPDAVILNKKGGDSIITSNKEKVKVTSDGQLTWSTRGTYVTSCSISMSKFPYDQHICNFGIGPEVSTSQQQIFSHTKNHSTSTIQHKAGWAVSTSFWSCPEGGQCLYGFTITRLGDHQYIISTIPLLVLSVMSCFVFILSAKTIEKMTFILVVFATYTFVLVSVHESFNVSVHGYSYLYVYFVVQFGIIGLMSIIAIFTVNVTCKDDLNISSCLECLARTMTCKLKKLVNVISSERSDIIRAPGADMTYKTRTGKFSDSSGSEYVHEITWIDVATGLDKLFFILFLLVNIISPIVLFVTIKS